MSDVKDRPVLTPGPDHTLSIDATPVRVAITAQGESLAQAAEALVLREHTYAPVLYVDRAGIDPVRLVRSERTSWCPYKGEASYFHLVLADGSRLDDAVWSYETPFDHARAIKDRLGFYTDRVDVTAL